MFSSFLRVFIASLKLIGKIIFILTGAVFSGIANAFFSMIDSNDGSAGDKGVFGSAGYDASIVDEASAARALNDGDITTSEYIYHLED